MNVIDVLIYAHVLLGSFALLFGLGALVWKKGDRFHKKVGSLFFYTMLFSSILAMITALTPSHENSFLFSIGIFTIYMLLSGKSALKHQAEVPIKRTDYILPVIILLAGPFMIIGPVFLNEEINIISSAMGIGGIIFGLRDIHFFRKPFLLRERWLQLHVGKIVGSYIAAVTAFTVNQIIQGIWGWFAPGIIGGMYITVWMIRLERKQKTIA